MRDDADVTEAIARELRYRMDLAGMNRMQRSERSGITYFTLQKYMAGENAFSVASLIRICDTLQQTRPMS